VLLAAGEALHPFKVGTNLCLTLTYIVIVCYIIQILINLGGQKLYFLEGAGLAQV
jgi:hypothetical protein